MVNATAAGWFLLSAIALLGSPGPGIAALVAIGRRRGVAGTLRFFFGLQLGLATAAGMSASGLLSISGTLSGLTQLLTIVACLYLAWLAWSIATSPVGSPMAMNNEGASTFTAGLLLGISNPKAYLAFISLFASQTLVSVGARADAALKCALTVAVIVAVDVAWLYAGAHLGRLSLSADAERKTNVLLGMTILIVALHSLRGLWT